MIVVTAMATWCEACLSEIPQLELLDRSQRDSVYLSAIPIDEQETEQQLAKYIEKNKPPYELMTVQQKNAKAFTQFVVDNITPEAPRLLLGEADLTGLRHPIPRCYLRLAQDNALPLAAQNKSIESLGEVDVIDLDTGHNIMISAPGLLAAVLNGYL